MKLRIKGNSLRLRFSQPELARLVAGQSIEESVCFSEKPEARLIYSLTASRDGSKKVVDYARSRITVYLTAEQVTRLNESNEIGIYTSVPIGSDDALDLMVEKDFACLDGSNEDDRDTFDNPQGGGVC